MSNHLDIDLYGQPVKIVDEYINEYVYRECNKGHWKPELFGVFDKFLKPGDVYFDIGAYVGATTLYPAALGCDVYAYEPDPSAFDALLANVKLNPALESRIKLSADAIGTEVGWTAIGPRGDMGSSKSGLLFAQDNPDAIDIFGLTLSAAMDQNKLDRLDFLKVNVQGSEASLLTAAEGVLKLHKPVVHVYIRPFNCADLWKDMAKLVRAMDSYPHCYSELGEPLTATDVMMLAKAKKDKGDFKLIFCHEEWPNG